MDIESIKIIKPKEKIEPHILKKSRIRNEAGNVISIWALNNTETEVEKIFEALQKKFKYTKRVEDLDDINVPTFTRKDDWVLNEDVTNNSHYNVLFSGGYDSTALLLKHLEQGDYVHPFCLDFGGRDRAFIEITVELLRSVYPNLGSLKRLFSTIMGNGNEEIGFIQQPFAAFYASRISSKYMENCKAVEIGYCRNDDALSWMEELKNLYNAGLETCMHTYRPPLEFPYIKKSHFDNSTKVEDFCEAEKLVLPVTCLDICEIERIAFNVYDEDPDLIEKVVDEVIPKKFGHLKSEVLVKETWLCMNSKEHEPRKENKSCSNFIPAYIIRIDYNLNEKGN